MQILHAAALFGITSYVPVALAMALKQPWAGLACVVDEGSWIMANAVVYDDHKEVLVADDPFGQRRLLFRKSFIPGYCASMSHVHMECSDSNTNCAMKDEVLAMWDKGLLRGAFTFYNGGEHIQRSINVGVGGGVIPTWMERHCPDANIQAADLSASVVGALPFFGVKNTTRKQILIEDGRKLVEAQEDNSVDMLFIDAMDSQDRVPACLRTSEFFQTVYSKLVPGGVVSINTCISNFEQDTIISGLRAAFPNEALHTATQILPDFNRFYVATKPGGNHARSDLFELVQDISSGHRIDFVPVGEDEGKLGRIHDAENGCI